jgi:hypothetical protein
MAKKKMKKVWYLQGPFTRYNENVKELAEKNGIRIIDSRFTDSKKDAAEETPKVTEKPKGGKKDKAS